MASHGYTMLHKLEKIMHKIVPLTLVELKLSNLRTHMIVQFANFVSNANRLSYFFRHADANLETHFGNQNVSVKNVGDLGRNLRCCCTIGYTNRRQRHMAQGLARPNIIVYKAVFFQIIMYKNMLRCMQN